MSLQLDPIDTNAWAVFYDLLKDLRVEPGRWEYQIPNTEPNRQLVNDAQHLNAPTGPDIEWEIWFSKDGRYIYTTTGLLMGYFTQLVGILAGKE